MHLLERDLREIRDLSHQYAMRVDSRDYHRVTQLFLPDGVLCAPEPPRTLHPTRELRGRPAIHQELLRLEVFELTFHAVVGQCIDWAKSTEDGELAGGVVNCVAHHVGVDRSGQSPLEAQDLVWHLRYHDSYAKAEGQWLLARRDITIEFIDTHPVNQANRAERLQLHERLPAEEV